jgi:hypothetical protein
MSLQHPPKQFNRQIQLGLFFMVVAALVRWFVLPMAHLSKDSIDTVSGVFSGFAVGCLIWGLERNRRSSAVH